MKILNLYAGIGGNRTLWGDDHEITAVENNREIALEYKRKFPKDTVIIADAHEFLINNFLDFDFIWSSPPCPSHSKASTALKGFNVYRFPDMKLYEEIIFLQNFFKGKFVVENVDPYYRPLLPATKIDHHLFWANFYISEMHIEREGNVNRTTKETLSENRNIEIPKIRDSRKALRNAVHPLIGKHILEGASQ